MAEEPEGTAGSPAATPPPSFDPKAIEAMVQGAVRTSIESLVKEGRDRQAEQDAATAADAARAKTATDAGALGDIFKPALEPAFAMAKNAETRAALAADAVDFYTTHSGEPIIAKYRGKIEEVITSQLKRGNLISRKDAWNWLRGGDLYDEISKETLTAHETKLEEARKAAAAGPSVTVPKFTKPIEQSSTEELGEALRGVTF